MSTIQTPARVDSTLHAPATGATSTSTGWGSPSDDSGRRQLPVAPAFDLARGRLPWLTVQYPSTGLEPRPTSLAHPDRSTHLLRGGHRAEDPRASCAREHRRGRGPGASGRGGP